MSCGCFVRALAWKARKTLRPDNLMPRAAGTKDARHQKMLQVAKQPLVVLSVYYLWTFGCCSRIGKCDKLSRVTRYFFGAGVMVLTSDVNNRCQVFVRANHDPAVRLQMASGTRYPIAKRMTAGLHFPCCFHTPSRSIYLYDMNTR